MIRSARGQILWWPAQEPPHPAAARVRFESSYENELTGQAGTHQVTGWGVAVPSLLDLVELGQTHRQGTLVDLATGRWVRVQGTPSARPAERVSAETGMVDALGRPRNAGEPTGLRTIRPRHQTLESPWVEQVARWTTRGGVWARARSEPIFDSVRLVGNERSLFLDRAFDNGDYKVWGVHTNLISGSGGMPQGQYAYVTGISAEVLDPRDLRPVPREQAQSIVAGVLCSFDLQQTQLCSVPLSSLCCVGPADADVVIPFQAPPVLPYSFPIALDALTQFRVVVRSALAPFLGLGMIEQARGGEPALLRVTLHAHVSKGLVE